MKPRHLLAPLWFAVVVYEMAELKALSLDYDRVYPPNVLGYTERWGLDVVAELWSKCLVYNWQHSWLLTILGVSLFGYCTFKLCKSPSIKTATMFGLGAFFAMFLLETITPVFY